ncbi:PIN domain-containing protein [Herbidospora daliensis]|uniref:PIN domain-containing protein n=1 Tax=Herbidospora daliensis TaxID=295585 RepID=UPI0007C7FA60|nr:PIN domain-containing protein [Herbidospora daliensis]
MPFSAVLDACVLFPNALRDTLLRLAQAGTYQPLWSERILAEVHGALIRKGLPESNVTRMVSLARRAFPEATVTGWESLERSMTNDPKDRHVLAAAVRGHAHAIVTFNLRDFPLTACEPWDIEPLHPDTFLLHEVECARSVILNVLKEQAAATGKPPRPAMTLEDVLSSLEICGSPASSPRFDPNSTATSGPGPGR